jgi:dipeptidyl aminopeptidase/acylaminoacyl peptidase
MTRARFQTLLSSLHSATAGAALVWIALFVCPLVRGQAPAPRITIEDECTAIAYAPDGRLAYSTKHVFTVQKFEVQRDDIWILETDGRRRRIINGEKLARGDEAFSYTIIGLRWSADGRRITADISTSQLSPSGETLRDQMLLLLAQDGKEIKIAEGDNLVTGTQGGAWIGNEDTVAFLTETVKPKLMFSISMIQSPGGRTLHLFDRRAFAAVAWNARLGTAVAIERNLTDADASEPRLVELDLLKEDYRLLGKLDGYFGSLSFSPSGDKVAYFRDSNTVEVRKIEDPLQIARVHVAYGVIAWSPDESRLLIKRGLDRQEGDLVWVPLPGFLAAGSDGAGAPPPEPTQAPLLGGRTIRDFALAPDGHSVAVLTFPKRTLEVFDLQ